MKASRFMIPTLKEVPAEATIASHKLMLRAGLIRKMSSGIYSYLPFGLRALRKVEAIIREQMDRAGAQEFRLPLLVPRELWEETGRYSVMGDLMMKIKDRGAKDFVLAPTQEEGFSHVIRGELNSYKQLPFTVYQINTKFRDELRPRFGVMRGREFIMKDAYSFDRDEASLDSSYSAMREAYINIFRKIGLETVRVKADSGAMGGSGSEEFMVPSHVGEDEIIVCRACGYAANNETAACAPEAVSDASPLVMEEVDTPNVRTIEELTTFFECDASLFIKTLIYTHESEDGIEPVVVLIRGDLDVNEIKLANQLAAAEVFLADDALVEKITGAPVGFAGPVGLENVKILVDRSVEGIANGITGANKVDKHLKNVVPGRDFVVDKYLDLRTVCSGDACVECGAKLDSFRGIEVGHIFKLGDKYTKSMQVSFLDESGKDACPIMGCYGIGVDRSLASVIEQNHDENGIIWPMSVAPFHVLIIPIKYKEGPLQAAADKLYSQLWDAGIEALLDDRDARPGFKFKDADLSGIPIRVTVGDKGLEQGAFEIRNRVTGESQFVAIDEAVAYIKELKENMEKELA